MRRRLVHAVVLLTLAGVPVLAQTGDPAEQTEEPAARFGEEVEVIEVLVDVLATDRRGRVVTGLTAADFVVTEDGEEREVTSSAFYSTNYEDLPVEVLLGEAEAAPMPEGFPPAHLPASRYFIFFFHDQTFQAVDQAAFTSMRLKAARDARLWLEKEIGPSDWVAVARYDSRLDLQTDFTQDLDRILAAVDDATLNRQSNAMRPSIRDRRESGRGPSLSAGLPDSFDLGRKTKRVEHAVRLVAEAARNIIGRKNLVLFTLGFASEGSQFGTGDERYYPAMEAALNDANIAVYPIDLSGSGSASIQSTFLSLLAEDTGGIYFSTFNRFLDPLNDIGRYNTGYYLLSFRTEVPAGESGYREFKVRSKQRGVRINARRGFRFGAREAG